MARKTVASILKATQQAAEVDEHDVDRIAAALEAAEVARDEAEADIVRLERALAKARDDARQRAVGDDPVVKAEIEALIAFVRADQAACAKHPNANPNAWQMREREGTRGGSWQRWSERVFVGPASLVQFKDGTVCDLEGVDITGVAHRREALARKTDVFARRRAFRWGLVGLTYTGGQPLTDGDLTCAINAVRAGQYEPLATKLARIKSRCEKDAERERRAADEGTRIRDFMAQ